MDSNSKPIEPTQEEEEEEEEEQEEQEHEEEEQPPPEEQEEEKPSVSMAGGDDAEAKKEVDGDPSASHPSIEGASPGKIFVGGLPKETSLEAFTEHFAKYGEITDSVIMKHRGTGHPRGFGFITFKDHSAVDAVILATHVFGEKQVEIKRTIPKGAISGKDFKTKKIFVGGIPTTVNEDEFKNFFAKFGEIEEHQLMRDRTSGRSRGFGFISFTTEKVVDDLLTKGNRIDFAGAQVEIKKAEPKRPTSAALLPPAKPFSNPRPGFGRGFKRSYDNVAAGGVDPGSYRLGGYGNRRGYGGGYGASEFDGGYGGYSSSPAVMGSYRDESSLGFSGRYGGGFGRGYDAGGYSGPSEGFGRYGGSNLGGTYESGYGSGPGGGYGSLGGGYGGRGGGLYGSRRDYGSGAGGRYHPYAR